MHCACVAVNILLHLAPVATEGASDGLVIAMTQEIMPLQCASVRELRPTRVTHVSVGSVLLADMQIKCARGFELRSAIVAHDCPHILVCEQMPFQIRLEPRLVAAETALQHGFSLLHITASPHPR